MIKIPKDLQSMISASYHVNSFKRVVEELVYNSLDADSTSIAIRVNIQKNSIQVIDNGIGIKQNDFILLGERYTTSKFDNISVVKSTPHTYGFRGLSLASIIDISSVVKIVSRFMNSKDTLSKIFNKGESEEIVKTDSRPSKGTTVEIYGLLCNLKIQKKALEQCNELFAIKMLLEQLSLMHVNVSFSLRDDGKNEIIFKIQKNRNVFQTISSLFSISPQELLEITAEKYHYKVKAFIEKRDASLKKIHWLFLNGKYISKTKVHKIVNKLFLKSCLPRRHYKKNKQEDELGNQALPTYFLFISCPYSDYDVLYSNSNKVLVEFKNWEPITNLIERLVQCYTGDIKLKEITKLKNIHTQENKERDTRDQIKNIIDKFLAINCKKQNIKMCNGIKGKEIKRIRQQNVPKNKFKINMNKTNQSKISHNKHSFLENCNSKRKRKLKTYNDNSIEDKTTKLNIKNYKSNSERITLNNNKFLKTLKETKFPHKFKNADDSNHLNESHAYITPDRRPHEAVNLTIEKPPEFKLNPVKDDLHNGVKEFDIDMHPKHLLKEICKRTDLPKTTEKTVMTTYDLVQTVTNNYKKTSNFIVSNKVSNNFISNKIYVPEYKMFVNNSGGFNKRLFSNKLTFESHHYAINRRKKESHARFNRNNRFLNSRENENYNIKNKVHTSIKKSPKKYSKQCVINKIKNGMEKSLYTIQDDYSLPKNSKKTSGNFYSKFMDLSFDKCNTVVNSMFENNFISGYVDKRYEKDRISTNLDGNNVLGNFNEYRVTYSIKSSRIYTEVSEMVNDNENKNCQNIVYNDFGPTYTKNTEVFHHSMVNKDVSGFQRVNSSISGVDPIELCEITYEHNSIKEKMNMNKVAVEPNANTTNNDYSTNNAMDPSEKVISHHFHTDEINEIFLDTFNSSKKQTANTIDVSKNCNPLKSLTDFNMQSRYTFVPKGMSPIFTNCNFKPTYSGLINLNDEYYKDVIYEKFAEKVLETVHVFEPSVQNINVAVAYDGLKNNKMIKDNANLMFNGESIKNAKVLAQIDCKFIVTILPGKTISKNVDSNYLVLFDQHAVHERIRLENNLKDYFNGLAWKCVNTDAISLKLPKDDAALIHNHKDKLCTFGLQWSMEDSNISVYAIPEAILGKNPRPADVVLKATKCLLSELIDALKNLKGNIPLYPQSIMNLVFSEACRYAIMFGDKLSKSECIDLIHSLSECKTPFQCAHGRPVMAVIMEVIEGEPKYMFMDLSFDKCNTVVNSMFENNFISGYVDKRYEKDRISTNLDGNNVLGNFNEYRVTYSIKSSRIYTEVSEMVNDNENKNCQNIVYNDFGPTYTKNTEVFHHSMVNKDVSGFQRVNSSISGVDPIELCEITYEHNSIKEKMNMNKVAVEPNANTTNNDYSTNNAMDPSEKVISHHFHTDEINEIFLDTFNSSKKQTANTIDVSKNCNPLKSLTDFNMQSRYTFVPKGMSPIFTNCNFKPTYSGLINLNDEYYKDVIYEKFAEKVLETVHVFEPSVQNINVAVAYDGLKNNKMIKDNANLMFNGESIKNAKVLAQIDCKFIVTILPGKTISKNVDSNYLVLFDQHAVHERIRLENNLKDYFNGLAWKCVNTDAISLKLPKDDAALIHNHKDKLCTFGLQWSMEDSNISVYAIPEAILGKNPRPADVVLKATKCLLSELIDALKNLKGNIPLYPQSIMNLVFSEACRYAIMFGDKLSKSECVDLIHSLSECKTPFQCAHGRPVMAVIMEVIEGEPKYMVNTDKILEFKNKYYQIKNV